MIQTELKLYDELDRLTMMLIRTDEFNHYIQSKNALKLDESYQNLYQDFIEMKEHVNEVMRFGHYHPDYKTVMKKARQMRKTLTQHPSYVEYKESEIEFYNLLDMTMVELTRSVTDAIEVETNNPFYEGRLSGHSCNTDGQCGCS